MKENNFNEVYFNEIITEAHARPVFGWNESYFQKLITKMILKQIKKQAAKEFNDFFISKDLLDFKDVFKENPDIEYSGGGKKLLLKFTYTLNLNKEQAEQILIGIPDGKEYSKKGLLFNEKFMNEFGIKSADVKVEDDKATNKEPEEDEEEDLEGNETGQTESIEYIYANTIINEGLLGGIKNLLKGKGNKIAPPFNVDEAKSLIKDKNSLSIILEFDDVKYGENIKKKKWMLNVNYVKGMTGQVYFQYNSGDATIGPIAISDESGLEWLQKRTDNMEPPKPIKDEIKKIWNNPNQGAGLLGLATKKMIGGVGSTLFGPVGGSIIQEADLSVDFNEEYSMKNMKGERTKSKASKTRSKTAIIQELLNKASKNMFEWKIEQDTNNKKIFTCIASDKSKQLVKITIILG